MSFVLTGKKMRNFFENNLFRVEWYHHEKLDSCLKLYQPLICGPLDIWMKFKISDFQVKVLDGWGNTYENADGKSSLIRVMA